MQRSSVIGIVKILRRAVGGQRQLFAEIWSDKPCKLLNASIGKMAGSTSQTFAMVEALDTDAFRMCFRHLDVYTCGTADTQSFEPINDCPAECECQRNPIQCGPGMTYNYTTCECVPSGEACACIKDDDCLGCFGGEYSYCSMNRCWGYTPIVVDIKWEWIPNDRCSQWRQIRF